jgi:hypothetical protein
VERCLACEAESGRHRAFRQTPVKAAGKQGLS